MPNRASARTRDRVIDTVRALLAEGSFHEVATNPLVVEAYLGLRAAETK